MSSPATSPSDPDRRLSPGGLLDALHGVRKRATLLSVGYGVGLVVAAACGLLVLGAALDWLLRLPGPPRLVGLLLALGTLAWLGYRYVWRPATRTPSLGDIAGRVEERFPVFGDRLRSAVGFLGANRESPADPYRRRTIEQAGDVGSTVAWNDVLQPGPAARWLTTAGLGVVVLILFAMLLGPLAGTILGRLVDPLNPTHQWPKRYGVEPITLPDKHPAGRPLTVTATLSKGDAARVTPVVRWRVGDGPVRQNLMAAGDDGAFTATFDPRLADDVQDGRLSVWVEAGDDQTAPVAIDVVRRPELLSATLGVVAPPYVGDPTPRDVDLLDEPAVVGVGSTLVLRLAYSKNLADRNGAPDVELLKGDVALPPMAWRTVSPGVVETDLPADATLRFGALATGVDGFDSDPSSTLEVIVRPDAEPTVQIDEPRRNESRTPEAIVPVRVTAGDDFGLDAVDLVVEKLAPAGGTGWTTTVPLLEAASVATEAAANGEGTRYRLSYDWDLSALAESAEGGAALQPGDVIEFYARADDNFDLAGQTHAPVESGRLRITIISQQELNRRVIRELQSIKDDVESTRQRQAAARRETRAWAEQAEGKEQLDAADSEAAERLSRRQSREAAAAGRLADQAEDLQRQLQENNAESEDLTRLAERVAERLDDAAQGPMNSAAQNLDDARRAGDAGQRGREAEAAIEDQGEADRRLAEIQEEMESIGTLRQAIDDVAELLEQQRELGEKASALAGGNVGKTPEQMGEAAQQEAEALAGEQEELAEAVEAALEKLEEQAGEPQEAAEPDENGEGGEPQDAEQQDAAAEAMRRAAQAGRQQDVPGQQRKAAQASRQNQRQDGEQARQQAEIGLEIVLKELRDAERAQLRQLQRELAELREQIERLARLQAGHNADNLSLRGVEVPGELALAAGRDAEQAVEPTISRLSAGQEQSERNARDLARTADESAEDGGSIAELLTRAALSMERAAVAIRGDDLAGAYEPPQVRALDALREALAAAEAEEQRVQEEIEQEQREAVRQRLIAIRDGHAADVVAPAQALADQVAAGELNRRDRLTPRATLAPRERELAAELAEVRGTLGEVGGTVFVYAIERVERDMASVAEKFDALDNTDATRQLAARVESGLTDLVDSLELEMNEQRFDRNSQPQGGEGGEQGGPPPPPLPPAVEIKLFGKLQADLNERTVQADAANEDPTSLGEEQGELRRVLDEMLQKVSQGQVKFGPEPAGDTLLPEEAGGPDVAPRDVEAELDERELMEDLLGDAAVAQPAGEQAVDGEGDGDGEGGVEPAVADPSVKRLGDYLARARQRLSDLQDAGPVTQAVQRRIVLELDALAQQAQQQAQQQQGQPGSSGGQPGGQQQPGGPRGVQQQPGQQQGQQQQQQAGDGNNATDGPEAGEADLSSELEETLAEWGGLTPLQRQAILDTQTDRPLEGYRELVEAFNRELSDTREDE